MTKQELLLEYSKLKKYLSGNSVPDNIKEDISKYLVPREASIQRIKNKTTINKTGTKLKEYNNYIKAWLDSSGNQLSVPNDNMEQIISQYANVESLIALANSIDTDHLEKLDSELSTCDKSCTDILHYIEFNGVPLKGKGAVMVYNELHLLRRKRRMLKDLIKVKKNLLEIKKIVDSFPNLESRVYKFREYEDILED